MNSIGAGVLSSDVPYQNLMLWEGGGVDTDVVFAGLRAIGWQSTFTIHQAQGLSTSDDARVYASACAEFVRASEREAAALEFVVSTDAGLQLYRIVGDEVAAAGGVEAIARQAICHVDTAEGTPKYIACSAQSRGLDDNTVMLYGCEEDRVSWWAVEGHSLHHRGSTLTGEQPGVSASHLCLDRTGRFVITANYGHAADSGGTGNVSLLPVFADGSLGKATEYSFGTGAFAGVRGAWNEGPRFRQEGCHPHGVVCDPRNNHVFVADLGVRYLYGRRSTVRAQSLTRLPRRRTSLCAGCLRLMTVEAAAAAAAAAAAVGAYIPLWLRHGFIPLLGRAI